MENLFLPSPFVLGRRFHGSDLDLRKRLEPMLNQYGVNVVLNGHEHVYERLQPQHGIQYFVLGNSGQLRKGDLRPLPIPLKDSIPISFGLAEVSGDELYFQVISAKRETVDSGVLTKAKTAAAAA